MDDPESEGEIQENESSRGKNDDGKLSWMLRLGKKILVTGIVMSSAPIVLPPLVAISAIGIACSVPYGVFLVSYVCTETVMSRLLPLPSPAASILLLEYGKTLNDEEEDNWDEKQAGQYDVIIGGVDMETEEEEFKEDIVEEVEMRIESVDKEEEEFHRGKILQEEAYEEGGIENDEKKSMEEVDEIVEKNGYEEDDGEFLDEEEGERPSESFEIEVKEIKESEVKQPVLEESRGEMPAAEGYGFEAVVEGDEKHSSNTQKETPVVAENVEENEELVRETRGILGREIDGNKSDYGRDDKQSVENVDALRKPKRKTELKTEGTIKGKGEQSITESVNEQPGDEIHGFVTTIEADEKERGNENKETIAEVKNAAIQIVQATDKENDDLIRESRGSLEGNIEGGRDGDAVEDKQGVQKSQADAEGKLLKRNGGTTERKQEELHIRESTSEQPVDEISGVLGGLEGSERNVQLVQAIDIEEKEKLVIAPRGLSGRIRDESKTDREVDDKQRAERVNVTGVGKQSEEIEVEMEGTTLVQVEQYLGDESMSEQPIEEVCNIVVEFEGDEKNGSNSEKETPFQITNVAVQLSQSTDIEEDGELVRETRGLLEKIRDDGKTDYAGQNTEKEESKADNKVKMEESVENLDAASKESIEGLSGKMDDDKNHVEQNYLLNREKKDVIFSNEDEREIDDEQGLQLLEDLSTVSQQGSPSDVNTFEGSISQ